MNSQRRSASGTLLLLSASASTSLCGIASYKGLRVSQRHKKSNDQFEFDSETNFASMFLSKRIVSIIVFL